MTTTSSSREQRKTRVTMLLLLLVQSLTREQITIFKHLAGRVSVWVVGLLRIPTALRMIVICSSCFQSTGKTPNC